MKRVGAMSAAVALVIGAATCTSFRVHGSYALLNPSKYRDLIESFMRL